MLVNFKILNGATEHSFLTKMVSNGNKKYILGIYNKWIERPSIADDPTITIELSKVKFDPNRVVKGIQKRGLLDNKTKPDNVKAFFEYWFEKDAADFPLDFEEFKKRFNTHQEKMLRVNFLVAWTSTTGQKRNRVVPAHINKRVRRCFEVKDEISDRKFKVAHDGVITQKWEANETDSGRPLWTIKYPQAHVKYGKNTYVIESDEEDLDEDEVQKGLANMEMDGKNMRVAYE